MESNILWFLEQASEAARENGMSWYDDAYKWSMFKADQYDVEVDVVAAIISALSPRNEWSRNLHDTDKLLMCYERGDDGPELVKSATFGKNVMKAWRVRHTGDASLVMTSPKTRAFVDNITWPKSQEVTVDTWAYRIAEGDLQLPAKGLNEKRYQVYAEAYKNAAAKVELRPCELQAITWVEARDRVRSIKKASSLQLRLF